MKQPALVLCQLFKTGDNNSDHTQSNVSNSCSNRKHTPSCECNGKRSYRLLSECLLTVVLTMHTLSAMSQAAVNNEHKLQQ